MQPDSSPRPRTARRSIVALALASAMVLATGMVSALPAALAPSSARAAATPRSAGVLSSRLTELAKPTVRSAPPAKQAEKLSVSPAGPGSLLRDGNRVLVEVRFAHGVAAGAEGLRAANAKVVDVSRRYQTVTVAAKPGELNRIPEVPRVAAATEVLTPLTSSTCPSGAVVSEGLAQLHAGEGVGEARAVFPGIDGSGVTVGILSDSFDRDGAAVTHASGDVASGDLPGAANTCSGQSTPVGVLDDSETAGADEGRAMSQIVHDLAPGADLSFATAFTGLAGFAANVEALAAAGAQVIADDVTYFEEPFFQEGPVGVAASNVTAGGVDYFSSAANNNLIDGGGNDIASWEASQFRDAGSCPSAVVALEGEIGALNANHCMDFNPGAGEDTMFGITVSPGAALLVDLQWAEPWEGVNTDLDAFLIGPGGEVVAWSLDYNIGGGRPFELVSWENESASPVQVKLAINRYEGIDPRLKFSLLQNGGGVPSLEYPESSGGDVVGPTIFGHNGGEDVTSVAAIRYDSTTAPETYSSRGPVTHYFGPVTGTGTPAAPLASPEVLSKPDLTATDCGVTTFFAFEVGGSWRFCGTSAAAPHAAAVAALMRDADPSLTPAEIREAMAESAQPIGAFGPEAVGAGLVDAVGALDEVAEPAPPKEESGGGEPEQEGSEGGSEGGGEAPSAEVGAGVQTAGVAAAAVPSPTAGVADRVAPETFLRHRPRKLIRTRHQRAKAVFRFRSNERGASFLCRVDRGRFRPCKRRFARRYRAGKHVVRVKARDRAGNVDRTPAVYRFRVKRLRSP
jgi:hypothetical protein